MTLQGRTVNTASYLPFQWLSTTGRFVFEDFTRQDIIPSLAEIFNLNFAMSLFSMYINIAFICFAMFAIEFNKNYMFVEVVQLAGEN